MLFVPGDSERKFARGSQAGADALILDLEDAVAPANKPQARAHVASLVAQREARPWRLFVRINALDTGLAQDDLAAAVGPGLDGVVIPKANGAGDVGEVGALLDTLERDAGITAGTVRLAVVATETAGAIFNLGSYAPPHSRLVGLTWGAEDLAAAVGATDNKEPDGAWTSPYVLARSLCLFAAASAGVAPIETLYADFRDPEGLARNCRAARRDGFVGRLAIHPDQVATINACFSPSAEDVARAQQLVAAFDAAPGAGTIGLDGKMYDIPHLKAALRTLAAAQED